MPNPATDNPQVLYKYLDRSGLDLLARLRLKASSAREMNDPFEWQIDFSEKTTEEAARERGRETGDGIA